MKEKGCCQSCAGVKLIDTKTETCQSCYLGRKRGKIITEYVKRILAMKNGESRLAWSLTRAYFQYNPSYDLTITTPIEFIKDEYRNYKLIDNKKQNEQ